MPGSHTSIRWTGPGAEQRDEEGVEHPDEVADRCTGEVRRPASGVHVLELTRLEGDGPLAVDDALRVTGRPRGEGHDGRGIGVDGGRCEAGRFVEHRGERPSRTGQRTGRRAGHEPELGRPAAHEVLVDIQIVGATESVGGHDHVRMHGAEDVVELLRPVEVHDGDDDGTEIGRRPEGDARLDPVGQLEGDDAARADAPGGECGGEGPGGPVDLVEGPVPGVDVRVHPEADPPEAGQALRHQRGEGGVTPPSLGQIPLAQLIRQRPCRPTSLPRGLGHRLSPPS